jgi:spore coat polysaccharide biosynthesis protein SpsF (cytidylyltransferase family)
MSFQSFIMKRLLKSKMKDVPVDQQEKVFAALEKNPQLFQNIALEVQEKIKQGKDQMAATMEVMQKYQDELKNVM